MNENFKEIRQLMLATNKIDGVYYFFAKKLGINENKLAVLYALDDGNPHSQKQICEEWLIPKTTISTIIKELEAEGYLTLVVGSHTKEKTICLTDKGVVYVKNIMKEVYEAEQAAMEKTVEKFSSDFVTAMGYFSDCLCNEFQKRKL